jgi:hypothetical protein
MSLLHANQPLPRIFLANVGVNASHINLGLQSPRFPDGRFEFIPIPELKEFQQASGFVRYNQLQCWNETNESLARYIPINRADLAVHTDPDFTALTYGDECGRTSRAAALKQAQPGDILVFLARLADYRNGLFTGQAGFYLVGFLEIAEILKDIRAQPEPANFARYMHNAHLRRAQHDPRWYDGFYIFEGSARSRRFQIAYPFGKAEAEQYLRDKSGQPFRWQEGRTELQTIGSYTRTCRCVLDAGRSAEEKSRALAFIGNILLG